MASDSIILLISTFIFGTVIGSFLNVCIHRIPRGESIVYPPSKCPSCEAPIRFYDNIPVVSYLVLLGKCRNCKTPISPVYPLVEFLTGVILLLIVWNFGLTIETLFHLVFVLSLLVITFIDLEHMIIPNVITFPGIAAGVLYGVISTDLGYASFLLQHFNTDLRYILRLLEVPAIDSLFGLILGGGILFLIAFIYEAVRKREGMGMGDVKLLAMIGAFIGWKGVIFTVFLSSVLGTVVGIAVILYQKGDLQYALPFGPFLSLAAVVYVFTGGFSLTL